MIERALLAALLAAIGGAARADAEAPPAVVRLGNLKFAHYGAVSYMKEECARHGVALSEHVFAKGIDIVPALLAGEIDLAASAVDAAVSARAAGAPILVVAGFARGGARLLGRSGLGITSVAQLKGRRVGVPRGGAQELLLLAELAQASLSWSEKGDRDVQLVYLAYADLNQALLAGQIDAISQSEPQSSQAIAKGFGNEIIKPYDTPLGEPSRALVMTEQLYSGKPEVARRVLDCFVASTKAFLADPQLAERYVREQLFKGQLGAAEYREALANAAFTYDLTVAHVQATADLMVKYGVGRLTKAPAAAGFVRLELLHQAMKAQGVEQPK
jgi:NitT/TauT family transport system substrate-binding protein